MVKDPAEKTVEEKKEANPAAKRPAAVSIEKEASTQNSWKDVERHGKELGKRPWNATVNGRFAIRAISRGIFGALFYGVAQQSIINSMKEYDPRMSLKYLWDKNSAINKPTDTSPSRRSYSRIIAKLVDLTFGKGIAGVVKFFGGDGVAATRFRPTRSFYDGNKQLGLAPDENRGRSLGHEAINVSGDFFMMSIGDALFREHIIPMFDPNAKKEWLKKEEVKHADGTVTVKRHIDFGKAVKSVVKAAWRLVTYNAGEDVAVTIPYVYMMKAQRNVLERIDPGFAFDSDHSLNGGSRKVRFDPVLDDQKNPILLVNESGKKVPLVRSVINGDYHLSGMADLMGRFTSYNVGTLMFREGYNALGKNLTQWWKGEKKLEVPLPHSLSGAIEGAFGGVYKSARYLVRSTVKAVTYMVPASFVFAFIRTSQSKDIGALIHPEHGIMRYKSDNPSSHIFSVISGNGIESGGKEIRHPSYGTPDKYHAIKEVDGKLQRTSLVNGQQEIDPNGIYRPRYEYGKNSILRYRNPTSRFAYAEQDKTGESTYEDTAFSINNPFAFIKSSADSEPKKASFGNLITDRAGKGYKKARLVEMITNPVGLASYIYGSVTKPLAGALAGVWHRTDGHKDWINPKTGKAETKKNGGPDHTTTVREHAVDEAKSINRRYAKAALSYWPYFFVKSDWLAQKWDTPRMDVALDRAIDGVFHLNWKEIKAGAGEYIYALKRKKFDDPERENVVQDARRRDVVSGSGTSLWNRTHYNGNGNGYDYMHGHDNGHAVFSKDDQVFTKSVGVALDKKDIGQEQDSYVRRYTDGQAADGHAERTFAREEMKSQRQSNASQVSEQWMARENEKRKDQNAPSVPTLQ